MRRINEGGILKIAILRLQGNMLGAKGIQILFDYLREHENGTSPLSVS